MSEKRELDCPSCGYVSSNINDEIDSLRAERDEALRYATSFLESYVRKYCNPIPEWKPLPDLIGVLTQIDNASTVTGELREQLEKANACLRQIIEADDEFRMTLPDDWEGDPLSDAVMAAKYLMAHTDEQQT